MAQRLKDSNSLYEQIDHDPAGFVNRFGHFLVDVLVATAAVAAVTACVASAVCGVALGAAAVGGVAVAGAGAHLAIDHATDQDGPASYSGGEAFRSSGLAAGTGAVCALGFGSGCLRGCSSVRGRDCRRRGTRLRSSRRSTLPGTSDLPKPWNGLSLWDERAGYRKLNMSTTSDFGIGGLV